jgi:hypothetical protein
MFEFFRKKLPHCDDLFEKYLSPWYPAEERPKMTRPDLYVIAGFQGQALNMDSIQYLNDEALARTKEHLQLMAESALHDYKFIIDAKKIDLNVLDAVDKYYNRKRISEIIKASDPSDFSNQYLVSVCEFGAILGHLFLEKEGFSWLYSYPYFHSIIVHRDTGFAITVFDWAVKKFSEYGVDDGFVAKFNAAIETIANHPSSIR